MAVEVEKTSAEVGFLRSECFNLTMLSHGPSFGFVASYSKRAFQLYAEKRHIISTYIIDNHWIVVVILLKQKRVLYLDSLKSLNTDISLLTKVIDE
jgi:Ulp1 family protease